MNPPEAPPEAPKNTSSDPLAQLLAQAGPRRTPPALLEAEVRAAVHAEWQHLTQGRKAQQRRRWLAAATIIISVFSLGWLARQMSSQKPALIAPQIAAVGTITQTQGSSTLNNRTVSATSAINGGDTLHTGRDGGLRVELSNGISLRIAAATELHWLNAGELQLEQGAVYVDSRANAALLTIHTARGDITHLGTRYRVNVDQQMLRVAVREGQVAIQADSTQLLVNALEQVQVDAQRRVLRSDLTMDDASWQWADALAQPFVLENRNVAEFLQWVGNETGYELTYASTAVKAAAARTLLHGQQTSLPPLQAMQTVLATTDFRISLQGRQLLISQAQ